MLFYYILNLDAKLNQISSMPCFATHCNLQSMGGVNIFNIPSVREPGDQVITTVRSIDYILESSMYVEINIILSIVLLFGITSLLINSYILSHDHKWLLNWKLGKKLYPYFDKIKNISNKGIKAYIAMGIVSMYVNLIFALAIIHVMIDNINSAYK